jgi:hypothetical protein
LVFIDVGEDSIMVDDATMPSTPPIVLVENEELEKAQLDMNVSQCSHEAKSSRKVVRTQVDQSAWDRQLSYNPHALIIYLEFVPAHEVEPERSKKC